MTLTARVAAHFKAHPNVWIDAREFLPLGGFAAWRTRLAECRKAPYLMQIDNEVERTQTSTGQKFTVSRYRYRPTTGQAELFEGQG